MQAQTSRSHRRPSPSARSSHCPALAHLGQFVDKKKGQSERLVYAKPGVGDEPVLFSCGKPPPQAQQDRVRLRTEQTALLRDFLQNTLAGQIRALNTPQGRTALTHIDALANSHDKAFTVDELARLNRRLHRCLDAPSARTTRQRGQTWCPISQPQMVPMHLALQPSAQPGTTGQGSSRNSLWFRKQCEQKLASLATDDATRKRLEALAARLASALDAPRNALSLKDLPGEVLDEGARLGMVGDFLNARDNLQPPLERKTLALLRSALQRSGQDA